MAEIFMISQLMTQLSNMTKLEKYQQDKAADISKQDADLRAIQQIIFIGKTSEASIIYYIYEKSKETILEFSKGTTKVL